jgi:hypothetical protein
MRLTMGAAMAAAVVSLAGGSATAQDRAPAGERAVSAQRFAQPASYHGPALNKGYSAQARRIADCLATQAARADGLRLAPAVSRRCEQQLAQARR